MPKQFVLPGDITGSSLRVSEDAAHHLIHVLRVKPGESVTFCDG